MAIRSLIAFAAMIAVLELAGCGKAVESGVAGSIRSPERKAERDARDAHLRRLVEAGTFGTRQLFPGGMVDARHLPPLRRTFAVAAVTLVPAPASRVPVPVARLNDSAKPKQLAFLAVTGGPDACVYKPVMSDADLDACR